MTHVSGPSSSEGAAVAHRSFAEFGAERLAALCEGLGARSASRELVDLFRLLVHPWGAHRIGTVPRYLSNVADDQAPFEFAVAISKGPPEIQVYVDPQGEPPTPGANLAAARGLLELVATKFGVSLERFRAIESLFLPQDPEPPFALWIGGSWTPERDLLLKIYLNPQVRGRASARELIAEAMQLLGLERAWRAVERTLSLRDGRDELGIVALDLGPSGSTRLKLYIRHHRASVPLILPIAQLTGEFEARDVETFYASLSGNLGPFLDKPIATVFAFREAGSVAPEAVSLEFPIGRYVENDEVARARIQRCLRAFGLATDAYERALHALAIRPLAARAGIHAHVTLRRLSSGPRVGVYFASEAYGDMRLSQHPRQGS
jgi:DMATS type aromatic prenyltransferase